MRKFFRLLLLLVVVVSLGFGWRWWQQAWHRPIKVVSLVDKEKLQYADPVLFESAVAAEVKRGFFGVRLGLMRDRLLDVPWIIGAQVQRKWPDTILIQVQERQPLALWSDNGVIDTSGKLFYPTILDKVKAQELPEFVGESDQLHAMVEMYLHILAKIKPIGLAVKRLSISADIGWQAMLDNGVTIVLGQNELEERLTRFVLAYGDHKSGLRNGQVRVVDLRYTNGLATSS